MQALRLHERGGAEQIRYESAPRPFVGIGDVLLRVHAASFNPTELAWPETWVDRSGRERLPTIPAHEVSGEVAEVGPGTSGADVGDVLYAMTDWYRDGAAAEYVAVEARNAVPKPVLLDHAAAASVPLAGLTAYEGLFRHGGLTSGQTVLVHGAGGGVGTFAVQLAAAAGAKVVATGRPWAAELVRTLGAQMFVDVEQEPLEEVGEVELVFDLVGGELLARSWPLLAAGGIVVSAVEPAVAEQAREHGRRGVYFVVEPSHDRLCELTRRIDAGELRPVLGGVLPLAQGREAFERKQHGGTPGKTVLAVVPEPSR